jgi:hypothetical protein
MSAASITRPTSFLAAGVAVAAIAAGTVALSVSHHAGAPAEQPSMTTGHQQHHTSHPATTSGGRVMLGE